MLRAFVRAAMLAALLPAGGCFLTSSSPLRSSSLELGPAWNGMSLDEISTDPFVYRVGAPTDGVFLTAIRECGHAKPLAPDAAARRLLIGLRDITFLDGEPTDDPAGPPRRLRAVLEDTPLLLSVYTAIDEHECEIDHVVWRRESPAREPAG